MPSSPEHPAPRHPIIVREGWSIIAVIVAVCAAVVAVSVWLTGPWGWLAVLLAGPVALWSFWFFRDPERATPPAPGVVVSPADGVVCAIDQASPPPELGLDPAVTRGMNRVCVFMNVFNVHVNRAAAAGRISKIAYRPGKFFNASFDKASEHNERCSLVFDLDDGRKMVIVQIAGLIARRIICRVKEGQRLTAGERFGLIRFGSRVDLYLPAGVEPRVQLAQTMLAGLTEVASLGAASRRAPDAGAAGDPVLTTNGRRVAAGSLADGGLEG